jgi:hypothetical protein
VVYGFVSEEVDFVERYMEGEAIKETGEVVVRR